MEGFRSARDPALRRSRRKRLHSCEGCLCKAAAWSVFREPSVCCRWPKLTARFRLKPAMRLCSGPGLKFHIKAIMELETRLLLSENAAKICRKLFTAFLHPQLLLSAQFLVGPSDARFFVENATHRAPHVTLQQVKRVEHDEGACADKRKDHAEQRADGYRVGKHFGSAEIH